MVPGCHLGQVAGAVSHDTAHPQGEAFGTEEQSARLATCWVWGAWAIRAGVSSKWLHWMGPVSRTEDWTGGGDIGVITSWGAEWTTSLGSMHSAEGGPRRDTHTHPFVSTLNAPCQMSAMSSLPQGPSFTLAPEAGTVAQPTRRCYVTPHSLTTAIRARPALLALPSAAPDHLHCCTLFCKEAP